MPSCNGPNSIILQNLIFRVRDDVRRAINEMKSDVGSQGDESEVDGCIGYAVDSSWGTAAIAGSYPGFVLSWLEVQENGKFGWFCAINCTSAWLWYNCRMQRSDHKWDVMWKVQVSFLSTVSDRLQRGSTCACCTHKLWCGWWQQCTATRISPRPQGWQKRGWVSGGGLMCPAAVLVFSQSTLMVCNWAKLY